ncbi:PDR/VanB family oxidoreductase [Saccharopolyspora sp. TS4A08]|uniref:PDR/VanB family oxidoreductase n=1 Tax=Saccharopolyspora ipomoeae TaxID=3042027 RepID=A0ABT6PGU0_9PSEU|nr:PDR/VanB family oxidoreductase [Saccharopolyspora sp. TS4A08]MDI2027216.1 PDR/VanB family oxidoreductase [Saccharopolyspora sp. TS4A08]
MNRLTVSDTRLIAEGVRRIRLVGDLRSYVPGSHLDVLCGTDERGRQRRNAYSLTGDGFRPEHYEISVRLGTGGSRWMHRLRPGDVVETDGPRSGFAPVQSARHHLLVAAGIGVTPILSHFRAARFWRRSVEVHHVSRDGVHAEDLRGHLTDSRARFWRGLDLADQPLGTHLYACGPESFLAEVTARAREAGWPGSRVHVERFGARPAGGEPFTAQLRRSGTSVPVEDGETLLEALESAGVAVANRCRRGVCGECVVEVTGGVPLHRDLVLPEEERATRIAPCVSRARGEVELDL